MVNFILETLWVNITVRFYKYYSLHYIKKYNMIINKTFLKYEYLNFTLKIFEYYNL